MDINEVIIRLIKDNKIESAMEIIEREYKNNLKLYNYYTALSYCKVGNYKDAILLFNYAKNKGLNYYLLYYNLGVACLEENDYYNAEKNFCKVIELNKSYSKTYLNLAYIKLKGGDLKSAYRIVKLGLSFCNDTELKRAETKLLKVM